MKTLKQLSSLFFALLLGASLLALPATAFASVEGGVEVLSVVAGKTTVADGQNLLSASTESYVDAMGESMRSTYDVLCTFVTVDDLEDHDTTEAYANDLMESYHFEMLASNGCIMCVLSDTARQYAIVTGGVAESMVSQSDLSNIVQKMQDPLSYGNYDDAAKTFYKEVEARLVSASASATSAAKSSITYNGTYVTDAYGLFTDEQRASLEAKATQLAQQYNMGVYLLVVDKMNGLDNPSSTQRTNFATSFYSSNGLGLGSGKDGIMLALAIDSRDYVTIAYGQGSYSFSDEGINAMEETVKDALGSNNWVEGAERYYDTIGEQLEYYSVSGKPWTKPDPLSFLLKILAILGIPAGVAFSMVGGEKRAMKTAREQTEASSYLDRDSFELTNSHDDFIDTSLTVVPRPKSEGSSGGWGGGGGGGFSSSGGGKF